MRLLPAILSADTASPGEREIFRRLQAANPEKTNGWNVLHSLDIAWHVRQVRGEADFVFIIPSLGVLVLEVKAHRRVRRDPETGLWHLGDDPPTTRSPFKQAEAAMYSLRETVVRADPTFSDVPFWHAVAFPYVEFTAPSDEWHSWQVIDRSRFTRHAFDHLAAAVLVDARRFLVEVKGWKHLEQQTTPTSEDCRRIAEILRPSFEFYESPKARLQGLDAELKQYTEEQYEALDHMEANNRVLFQGFAGTGKTLLALEAARRASLRGEQVLLLCFNRLLGDWLAEQCATLPGVTATTLHRFMLSLSGGAVPPNAESPFWSKQLPELAADALLLRDGETALFDRLVIDEGQDILHTPYLDLLDLCLRGGLAGGHWSLFGDFAHQDIYEVGTVNATEFARRHAAASYRLTDNCRNTPRIASFAHVWGQFQPNYRRVRRPDDGVEPQLVLYGGSAERSSSLVEALRQLSAEGFRNDSIVVLSPHGEADCAAVTVQDPAWRSRLAPFGRAAAGQIRYGSIHAFKGLEAEAVVVTDVPGKQPDKLRELLYVASTRALHRLTVLADRQRSADLTAAANLKPHLQETP